VWCDNACACAFLAPNNGRLLTLAMPLHRRTIYARTQRHQPSSVRLLDAGLRLKRLGIRYRRSGILTTIAGQSSRILAALVSCFLRHLPFVYNSVHSYARLRSSCCQQRRSSCCQQRLPGCRGQSSERLPRSPRPDWLKTERWENAFSPSSSAETATLRVALSQQPGGSSCRYEGGWAGNAVYPIRFRSVLNALRASNATASSAMASGTAKIPARKPRKRKT